MADLKKKVIEDPESTFGDIMIMALRYALGRRTYVTEEVPNFIKANSMYITQRTCIVMLRDVGNYISDRRNEVIKDDSWDYESWVNFQNFLFNLAKVRNFNVVGYERR